MASTTPTPAPEQSKDASQSRPSSTSSPNTAPNTRPRPPHAKSAPVLSTNPSGGSNPSSNVSAVSTASAPASTTERPAAARGYSAHLPYNPNRPPPHTYTRQHEFPPFPPLAQHPVLPFLTTAFTNTQESPSAQLQPARARPPLTSRANTGRQTHSMGISTIPTMDVSKNDPTAIFIRIPLVVPLVHNNDPSIDPSCLNGASIDGEPVPGTPLTYAILHAHRNWFLDADDFRKDNPRRIDYPPDLEPPRGWAPLAECAGAGAADRCKQAKEKKEKEKNNAVRTKGSYAHGEALIDSTIEYGPSDDCHEKTVLRCTFCRREYHGPNAKSMWRRHVFDKHKVAMKNRREGSAGMAPRLSSAQKKAKAKAAGPSSSECVGLGPPVELSTPLTLDLNNEENLIRLLERVVSGSLDINLPASLLNSSGNGNAINLETIALALQKSGISLAVQGDGTPPTAVSTSRTDGDSVSGDVLKHENKFQSIVEDATSEDQEMSPSHAGSSAVMMDGDRNAPRDNQPDLALFPFSSSDAQSFSQKRKADETRDTTLATSMFGRAPLKDNTILDRNNHNQVSRVTPSTPRRDKGKQKALPTTPGAPRLSQESFLSPSPSSRHPYTPVKPPAALRSRALATTGEESYLTLIVSSPATASPGRGSGRVSFTSPFNPRTSPMKRNDRDYPPTSDDGFGDFAASSPRYPFEFNIQGDQDSSCISTFESIPLELGNLGPAYWTPPSLGPPATVSQTAPRSLSRASSTKNDTRPDDMQEANIDGDEETELEYPEWSSPSDRARERRRGSVEDFDMDAYLDFEDAGPVSEPNLPLSPHKTLTIRGLQFSKEYGLLSPAEVERITASAHPGFEAEARSSKRRKVETS